MTWEHGGLDNGIYINQFYCSVCVYVEKKAIVQKKKKKQKEIQIKKKSKKGKGSKYV